MIKNSHKIFLCFLLLICGSVLFRNLDSLSVRMWDESRNAINAMEMVKSGNPVVVTFEGEPDLWSTKPPLLIWSMAISMKLIGVNELAARLPNVVAALITMVAVFLLLYKVSNSNIMASFGALALATFPGFIDYHVARNADFDAMLTMWVFLSACCFYLWINDTNERPGLVYLTAIAIAGAVLTKGIAAFLVMPGFIIYAAFTGKLKKIFTTKSVYIAIVIGLIPVLGFYLFREFISAGYIKAVIENELTGRYLNVNEEHAADGWFYFRNLIEWRLGVWKFVVPVAMVVWLVYGRKKAVGDLMYFGLICAVSFLLVISSSKTKLPWYDATGFPFLALVCGGGIILFFERLEAILFKPGVNYRETFRMVFIILLVAYPLINVHAKTSVRATSENTYPELFYGDMIKAFFKSRPDDSLSVVYDGYNSHALFYVRSYEMSHFNIRSKLTTSIFSPGEIVLTCEEPFYRKLKQRYRLETIFENNNRILSTVVGKIENPALGNEELILQLLQDQIDEILNYPDWKASIEKKALDNGERFETQLKKDAIYVLSQNNKITEEQAVFLTENIR